MKMKSIRKILLTLLAGFTAGVFMQSCSDDLDFRSRIENLEEDFTGITLLIPDVESAAQFGATRSDEYVNTRAYDQAKEGNFNTLYIAAVPVKDKDGNEITDENKKKVQTFLKTSSNGEIVDDNQNYLRYRINLTPGAYRLYVVANLNRYTNAEGIEYATFADIAAKGEDAIRKHILNFSATQPLEPGFLPMACLNEELKVGSSAGSATKNVDKDATINISNEGNKYVYADLRFLCSKVRYSILFDKKKATSFAANDVIDFYRNTASTPPFVTNLRAQTAINTEEDGGEADKSFILGDDKKPANWEIYLDRYIYSDGFDFYDVNKTGQEISEALNNLGQNPWTSAKEDWATVYKDKRAWQGVTYLPENPVTDKEKKTQLNFPYSFNGSSGANSPRKIELFSDGKILERSNKYDVYAVIKTPDPEQWQLNVFPEPWTLQSLVYQLHGPYELIVEASSIAHLSMEQPAEMWYRSDVPPGEIKFVSPQVSMTGDFSDASSMVDLYKGGVKKNADGSYAKNENGDYIITVSINPEIPYHILQYLGRDEGYDYEGVHYDKKSISYFHIVAGSLNKRIEIEDLDLDPYLTVDPQTIIVDTRELYTSGYDVWSYPIEFATNVDISNGVTLRLSDPSQLIATGKGDGVLKVTKPSQYTLVNSNDKTLYNITDKTGVITVNVKDIITGSTYWNENNEYKLTFSLKYAEDEDPIEKTVVIRVRPFSGSYVIHFRDNTKPWAVPHIYVYQLLTLPADLPKYDFTTEEGKQRNENEPGLHEFAGRIVGFIERNPNSGLQWNGAAQYVFSNNLSFRGWKGYGGPDVNNPWAPATCTYTNPVLPDNSNKSTMGFVMFGKEPDNNEGFWNYSYSYTQTYGAPENKDKYERYNYDVNFNGEHELSWDRWSCTDCKNMSPDYNDWNNERFYTGISMEREDDGWWKYTLTGVALPGRTMIIFANWHAPWNEPERDYRAEDYRWPGDYETGLPLFDFEDNEGWFLFDGNTTNADQKFYDDKPESRVIPHTFANYKNLKIGVKNTNVTSITVNGTNYSNPEVSGDIKYFTVSNFNSTAENITVVAERKTYKLYPKNFVKDGISYKTAQPLYTEYDNTIKLFVKWSDAIRLDDGWGGDYAYYKPSANGCDQLTVLWGSNTGEEMLQESRQGKIYGNYKKVIFNCKDPGNGVTKDKIALRLIDESGQKYKILKVEDLPQYYNPTEKYYQINWHLLAKP